MNRKIIIFDIDYTLFDTDAFKSSNLTEHKLYDEVLYVLEELSKDAELGVLSEGNVIIQQEKLDKTKISNFFSKEHTHIVASKYDSLKDFVNKYKNENIYLVDDRLPILREVKLLDPKIKTIWVKRGKFAMSQPPIENFKPNFVIDNLKDMLPSIGKTNIS